MLNNDSLDRLTKKFFDNNPYEAQDHDELDLQGETMQSRSTIDSDYLERFLNSFLKGTDGSQFKFKQISTSHQKKRKLCEKENWLSRKQLEEQQNLTFQPQLISNNIKYTGQMNSDFLARNSQWQDEIKQRRVSRVEDKAQIDQAQMSKTCTFKPQINKNILSSKKQSVASNIQNQTRARSYHQALPLPPIKECSQLQNVTFSQAVNILHQQLHQLKF